MENYEGRIVKSVTIANCWGDPNKIDIEFIDGSKLKIIADYINYGQCNPDPCLSIIEENNAG